MRVLAYLFHILSKDILAHIGGQDPMHQIITSVVSHFSSSSSVCQSHLLAGSLARGIQGADLSHSERS